MDESDTANASAFPSTDDDGGLLLDDSTTVDRLYMGRSAGAPRTWKVLPGGGDEDVAGSNVRNRRSKASTVALRTPSIESDDTTQTKRRQQQQSQQLLQSASTVRSKRRRDLHHAKNSQYLFKPASMEKIILETEISIADGRAVTMRILEGPSTDGDGDDETELDDADDDDVVQHRRSITINSSPVVYEHSGLVRVLTDSELDEGNSNRINATVHYPQLMNDRHLYDDTQTVSDDAEYAARRSPRRVTFGGEIIKLRTPDSDSVATLVSQHSDDGHSGVDLDTDSNKRHQSASARSSRRRTRSALLQTNGGNPEPLVLPSTSSASSTKHKQIEVLHNLQRSPQISPNRSTSGGGGFFDEEQHGEHKDGGEWKTVATTPRSWEELGLVDEECLQNLHSGVS